MPRRKYRRRVQHRDPSGRLVTLFVDADSPEPSPNRRKSQSPSVAVVIPAYGQQHLVDQAVTSVCAADPGGVCDVVVVDDASPEPIRVSRETRARVIHRKQNGGFVDASRAGAAATTAPFILFLNSDAKLRPGALEALLEQAHRGYDIVGCTIRSASNGKVQHTGMRLDDEHGPVCVQEPRSSGPTLAVVGTAFLVRRSAWERLGGWDPDYSPGYFEDADLCLRAHLAGLRVGYARQAVVDHWGGATFSDPSQIARSLEVFRRKWPEERLQNAQNASESTQCLPLVSVVLPVHNALHEALRALRALQQDPGWPVGSLELVLVDDASDEHAAAVLRQEIGQFSWAVRYRRHDRNQGYMRSVLRGISMARGAFIVLVNSDAEPGPGWAGKLVSPMMRDTRIALVNPVCNNAADLSVSLPQGVDAEHMALRCLMTARGEQIDVAYPVGMFLAMRRRAYEELGGFDAKSYPRGYGEETDLAHRALQKGWRTVLEPSCFVWHRGKASHGDRGAEMERKGVETFFSKHGKSARQELMQFQRSRKIPNLTAAIHAASPVDTRPAIVFYANELHLCGGVLACYRAARALADRGWRAVVAGRRSHAPWMMEQNARLASLMYSSHEEFASQFPTDSRTPREGVLVATIWFTSRHVASAAAESKGRWRPVYYVQDDESRFRFPDGSPYAQPGKVAESYGLIPHLAVNSEWVKEVIESHGHSAQLIPVGVDTDCFYPREKDERFTVLAMCRPDTPRRGYDNLRAAYAKLRRKLPDARLLVYGDPPEQGDAALMEWVGTLPQEKLADLMGRCHVLLEPSTYQGFGMPALEGMASGCAVVSTPNLGIDTYGRNAENCLITARLAEAVERIHDNPSLACALSEAGRDTGLAYDWRRIGEKWDDWLRSTVL